MSENANETVFLTSEVEAKAGVVNCCDTMQWYGRDMTTEEKAELKKQQREFDKSSLKKWLDQNALSAGANEGVANEAKKTGRRDGGKMNNHWRKVYSRSSIGRAPRPEGDAGSNPAVCAKSEADADRLLSAVCVGGENVCGDPTG